MSDDNDSFFDDEPAPKPQKPSKPAAPNAGKRPAARQAAEPAPVQASSEVAYFDRVTTYSIATLIGVIGLLIGALGGYWLGTMPVQTTVPAPNAVTPAPAAPSSTNPSLPPGHPKISVPSTTTTP